MAEKNEQFIISGSRIGLDEIRDRLRRLQGADNKDEEWDKRFRDTCGLLDVYIKNQERAPRPARRGIER